MRCETQRFFCVKRAEQGTGMLVCEVLGEGRGEKGGGGAAVLVLFPVCVEGIG